MNMIMMTLAQAGITTPTLDQVSKAGTESSILWLGIAITISIVGALIYFVIATMKHSNIRDDRFAMALDKLDTSINNSTIAINQLNTKVISDIEVVKNNTENLMTRKEAEAHLQKMEMQHKIIERKIDRVDEKTEKLNNEITTIRSRQPDVIDRLNVISSSCDITPKLKQL